MAHKKAAWSAKNLKDSKPKYRWVKLFWWEAAKAWNVVIRQKWDKYKAWKNTYVWKDFTIHAKTDGSVSFRQKKFVKFDWRTYLKTVVDVIPNE